MLIGHKKQWEFLKSKFESDQLSHAYLFSGGEGIGKKTFALAFAELIGCKFPDLMIVGPEEGGEISIKKIREVQSFLAYKSYNGGYKIVVVDDAHLMNQESQSCFLKTLEEPKGKTLLLLVTSKPDMLLSTIASRCQNVKFLKPKDLPINAEKQEKDKEILNNFLSVASLDLADKFKYVKELDFEKTELVSILRVVQDYLRKNLLSQVEAGKEVAHTKKLINLAGELNNKAMFTNANPKLALEILLMEF